MRAAKSYVSVTFTLITLLNLNILSELLDTDLPRLRGHNVDLAVDPELTCVEVTTACMGASLGDLTLRGKAGIPYAGKAIPNSINGAARAVKIFEEWLEYWHACVREFGSKVVRISD